MVQVLSYLQVWALVKLALPLTSLVVRTLVLQLAVHLSVLGVGRMAVVSVVVLLLE